MSTRPGALERNPWLGLASFTEDNRADFFGREAEIGELARRVQRRRLTVLFGKSGLGKTSLVQAGLVPQLRSQGYCPIPIRISYNSDAPEASQQVRQALLESGGPTAAAFLATAPGEASSWELLHRRGTALKDADGAELIPLLIFDQFEEIFTLAQSDDAGRGRAARFVTELADLVENRVPAALEARLEHEESLTEAFDFSRSDYRVLIVLREDYLAPLESLKKVMPSLAENRLRLAPMTGTQALTAVLGPGKGLVTEEVASAIVRFVAGGAELANAEVEPSLLSLICRELNDARIARQAGEISLDLLAGSHATILEHFYERALAGQPPAVRRIIEDELLTSSGYRESVAEEDLVALLAAAGGGPNTLAELVNRRLLRIEERLDVRRVELTHDVLCPVVKESRNARQEREAREATERLLAEQREREASARRSLAHARRVAFGCAALALLALGAAVLAYVSLGRAQRAEREARETHTVANQARIQAERLLGYLSDDFARTLESEGRLDVVAELSRRQIQYFHGLPPALRGPDTVRSGALALVQHARTQRYQGELAESHADAGEAAGLLEGLRTQGDTSVATATALARCYLIQALIFGDELDEARSLAVAERAARLLRPLAEAPQAGAAERRTYVEVLVRLGYQQMQVPSPKFADVVTSVQQALALAGELGARDLSDLDMAAQFAEGSWELFNALEQLGRAGEARQAGEAGMQKAEEVIARRPVHRTALHAAQLLGLAMTNLANDELKPADALRFAQRSEAVSRTLLSLDSRNTVTLNNLNAAQQAIAFARWQAGDPRQAIRSFRSALEQRSQLSGTGTLIDSTLYRMRLAEWLNRVSDDKAALSLFEEGMPLRQKLRQSGVAAGVLTADCDEKLEEAERALFAGGFERVPPLLESWRPALQPVPREDSVTAKVRSICLYLASGIDATAQYHLGQFAAAEQAWREQGMAMEPLISAAAGDQRELAKNKTQLAMAVARQGRREEAATLIAPVVKYFRERSSLNHGDRWLPVDLAAAVYAQALAEPGQRAALLEEAAALVDGLAAQIRPLRDVEDLRRRILEAQQNESL